MTYYALKIAYSNSHAPGQWPEAKAQTWMQLHHAANLWYPVEKVWRSVWDKTKHKRVRVEVPTRMAAGIALVDFNTEPHWPDILWNDLTRTGCEQITGWYGRGPRPLRVPDSEVLRMTQMPERAAAILREVEERRTIKPRCRAVVKEGAFAGEAMTVLRVSGKMAFVEVPILGGREAAVELAKMERVG